LKLGGVMMESRKETCKKTLKPQGKKKSSLEALEMVMESK
jgi:hypothetical protein